MQIHRGFDCNSSYPRLFRTRSLRHRRGDIRKPFTSARSLRCSLCFRSSHAHYYNLLPNSPNLQRGHEQILGKGSLCTCTAYIGLIYASLPTLLLLFACLLPSAFSYGLKRSLLGCLFVNVTIISSGFTRMFLRVFSRARDFGLK